MMAAQFPLDLVEELERTLPSYHLCVPSPVLYELEKIKKRSKGKNRTAASIALKIAKVPPFETKKMDLMKGESVDDALLRISKVLCTNDRQLRNRAREKEITVVYLRQRRYLAVDGHLKI
ncbi:PIN domain-containing protein [Methanobacterium petrolearium]|uniref:type II toxin-antitoxin system VapC family toxin n=1 Tax=Methanobacterium petrolearium TaxID=710190 RepID=UPI001AE677F5|nr:PIN domain-containing protein [Methanobacterium petrolearium]MBP1945760.1 rRNA-processing protein FCF1 [Methanobacterium petrolearium]